MIPDNKLEEIKLTADIFDVVSDHVKLKKSGSGFLGLCPFHNEKTPSFHVNPSIGIYKCFGCSRGGDAIQFLIEIEGVSFEESVRMLAERYHIEIPESIRDEADDPNFKLKEGVYHALRFAAVYFYNVLKTHLDAEKARNYLDNRGFTPDTIKNYGLGYALDSFNGLLKHAESSSINRDYLHAAGLIKKGNNENWYDTFRGRVMFPIFNVNKKIIAFGGRIIENNKTAKYINSPQTIAYDKSKALYGIHIAKNEIRKRDETILVEGYTDVLMLHQEGIKNCVSTSGTSLTTDQLRMMHKYSDNLLLIFDADQAGQQAMKRGLDLALNEGLQVRLLSLPDGEDPDTFVKQFGRKAFENLVEKKSLDFLSFLIGKAKATKSWDNPQKRSAIIERILETIALVKEPIERQSLILSLSEKTGIGDKSLMQELVLIIKNQNQDERRKEVFEDRRNETRQQDNPLSNGHLSNIDQKSDYDKINNRIDIKWDFNKVPMFEKEVIRLMLQYGKGMIEYVGGKINAGFFTSEPLQDFFNEIIARYQRNEEVSVGVFSNMNQPYPMLVADIFIEPHSISEHLAERGLKIKKDKDPFFVANSTLKALYLAYYEREMDKLVTVIAQAKGDAMKQLIKQRQDIQTVYDKIKSTDHNEIFKDEASEKIKNELSINVDFHKMFSEKGRKRG